MSNTVFIRGNKIAFSMHPGDFGDTDSYVAFDLVEMITPRGLFIPVMNHGVQVIPMLKDIGTKRFQPNLHPDNYVTVVGLKGVLIEPYDDTVRWSEIRVTKDGLIGLVPLYTGSEGFAVITPYEHLAEYGTTAVRLTNSIEDTVQMYCRHVNTDARKYMYWSKEDAVAFLKKHSKLYDKEVK